MRVSPSKLRLDMFRSMGVAVTPLASNELYTAMQTHVVDGAENGLQLILSLHLYEIQKYLSLTNHSWSGYWLFSTTDTWQKLPAKIQEAIARNNGKYALQQRHDSEILLGSVIDKMGRLGMTVNRPPAESFRAKLGPHYARFKEEYGSTAWALLEQHVGKLG
ncbi:MAG TPA: TRAP transporter substrate-binding protein DctP, partial [Vicinamibacterales bacterium]|nr:TRAP transporter substrate-binding protein DctP [Vicinamibacterales bacterium]